METLALIVFWLAIMVGAFIVSGVRLFKEYERGIVFRFGRLSSVKKAGLRWIIPGIDKVDKKLDLRVITLDVPPQEVISQDNIPIKVDAVLYFRVSDPVKAAIEIENYIAATSQVSQTSLRGVVGASSLDELLTEREKINDKLHSIIDEATDPWGVKVTGVEVKHVEVPREMQRAIAKQAEAERMRRAKIILAEGEFQAAQKLREAGDVLQASPIVLRYLETLTDAAKEPNTTILFPMEIITYLKDRVKSDKEK